MEDGELLELNVNGSIEHAIVRRESYGGNTASGDSISVSISIAGSGNVRECVEVARFLCERTITCFHATVTNIRDKEEGIVIVAGLESGDLVASTYVPTDLNMTISETNAKEEFSSLEDMISDLNPKCRQVEETSNLHMRNFHTLIGERSKTSNNPVMAYITPTLLVISSSSGNTVLLKTCSLLQFLSLPNPGPSPQIQSMWRLNLDDSPNACLHMKGAGTISPSSSEMHARRRSLISKCISEEVAVSGMDVLIFGLRNGKVMFTTILMDQHEQSEDFNSSLQLQCNKVESLRSPEALTSSRPICKFFLADLRPFDVFDCASSVSTSSSNLEPLSSDDMATHLCIVRDTGEVNCIGARAIHGGGVLKDERSYHLSPFPDYIPSIEHPYNSICKPMGIHFLDGCFVYLMNGLLYYLPITGSSLSTDSMDMGSNKWSEHHIRNEGHQGCAKLLTCNLTNRIQNYSLSSSGIAILMKYDHDIIYFLEAPTSILPSDQHKSSSADGRNNADQHQYQQHQHRLSIPMLQVLLTPQLFDNPHNNININNVKKQKIGSKETSSSSSSSSSGIISNVISEIDVAVVLESEIRESLMAVDLEILQLVSLLKIIEENRQRKHDTSRLGNLRQQSQRGLDNENMATAAAFFPLHDSKLKTSSLPGVHDYWLNVLHLNTAIRTETSVMGSNCFGSKDVFCDVTIASKSPVAMRALHGRSVSIAVQSSDSTTTQSSCTTTTTHSCTLLFSKGKTTEWPFESRISIPISITRLVDHNINIYVPISFLQPELSHCNRDIESRVGLGLCDRDRDREAGLVIPIYCNDIPMQDIAIALGSECALVDSATRATISSSSASSSSSSSTTNAYFRTRSDDIGGRFVEGTAGTSWKPPLDGESGQVQSHTLKVSIPHVITCGADESDNEDNGKVKGNGNGKGGAEGAGGSMQHGSLDKMGESVLQNMNKLCMSVDGIATDLQDNSFLNAPAFLSLASTDQGKFTSTMTRDKISSTAAPLDTPSITVRHSGKCSDSAVIKSTNPSLLASVHASTRRTAIAALHGLSTKELEGFNLNGNNATNDYSLIFEAADIYSLPIETQRILMECASIVKYLNGLEKSMKERKDKNGKKDNTKDCGFRVTTDLDFDDEEDEITDNPSLLLGNPSPLPLSCLQGKKLEDVLQEQTSVLLNLYKRLREIGISH